jgi:GAF domain-containing protein
VLLGERGKALAFAAAFGPEAHKLREIAIPAGTGFAGFSSSFLTALSVNNPYEDSRFCRAIDDITGYRTRSLLVVPIAVERRCFGVIELINSPSQHGFDDGAMVVLTRVAQALGVRLAASGPVEG